jgi:HK97 gp10 family phage protein
MAEFVTAEVTGLRELERNLNQLAEAVARKVLRKAARDAMGKMKTKIQAAAPVGRKPLRKGRTIRLSEGILMGIKIVGEGVHGASIRVVVGLRKRPRERWVGYGRYVEFGTVKIAAHPWMRPTWDSNKDQLLTDFADNLEEGITDSAEALGVRLL